MKQVPRLVKDLFINGQFVKSAKGATFKTQNPATQQLLAEVQRASIEDIDVSVQCAKKGFQVWSEMDPTSRINILLKLSSLIEQNATELGLIQSLDNGMPATQGMYHALHFAELLKYCASLANKNKGNVINIDGPFFAYTMKQPIGVVGAIIPWNVPLVMQSWKLAPALAAGCSIILKTAENTPLSALRVAELINQAGIPPGVVNIVSGFGDIGAYLAKHPDVDKVAFTGSLEVGYEIMRNSHVNNLKRVSLELGGKSPLIITKNANLQTAMKDSVSSLFFNAGQVCFTPSRIFVHSSIYDQYVSGVLDLVKKVKFGDPLDPETTMGPLISELQRERVLRYIDSGVKEGAKLMTGGKKHGDKGYFVEPTLFVDVKDEMKIAKEEIFGPVMSILKFEENQQVLERANNTKYGLSSGVLSENPSELLYFAEKLKAGTVFSNCYNVISVRSPFGGFKDSGIGRQCGEQALENYLEIKTIIQKK